MEFLLLTIALRPQPAYNSKSGPFCLRKAYGTTRRCQRGYPGRIYDAGSANIPQTLRRQSGEKYDDKKVGRQVDCPSIFNSQHPRHDNETAQHRPGIPTRRRVVGWPPFSIGLQQNFNSCGFEMDYNKTLCFKAREIHQQSPFFAPLL